jgi:hypothetical protein
MKEEPVAGTRRAVLYLLLNNSQEAEDGKTDQASTSESGLSASGARAIASRGGD